VTEVRRAAWLALTALVSGCALSSEPIESVGSAAGAITNGSEESGDEAVVALFDGDKTFCTGTLVSPRVVLTAAHCLVWKKPSAIYIGSRPPDGGEIVAVAWSRPHPEFDATTLANDLALVALSTPAPVSPVPMLGPRPDDLVGRETRLVGFGRTSPTDTSPLSKRSGTATIDAVDATSLRYRPTPSHACFIDSGGPAFVTLDREYLAGVTSAGDFSCSGSGTEARVDGRVDAWVESARAELDAEASGGCSISSAPSRSKAPALWLLAMLAVLSWWRTSR
jgi:hypothetical protein